VQHEQATRSAAVVGDDGGLHSELVRRGGLALADALLLRGMERIKLPAALALLLRADLCGPAKREGECLLQCWLSLDLGTVPTSTVLSDAGYFAKRVTLSLALRSSGDAGRGFGRVGAAAALVAG
jgi:hypothetical protein